MEPVLHEYESGITCIDTMLVQTGRAACYLLVQDGHVAFIDTGSAHTVPFLLKTLELKNIPPEAVDYVIPTHVHLDHAGGAGVLMDSLPNAKLVIHPRGAPHMIDPSRLVMGATEVYGESGFKEHFGEVRAIDERRVMVTADNSDLNLATRTLVFLHTPGHANHHFCIYDRASDGIFAGDTFGLSYKELDDENGAFIMPTTTPVQFDPDAWQESLTRLLDHHPGHMYLTHFGRVSEVRRLAQELRRDIESYADMARQHMHSRDRKAKIHASLTDYLRKRLSERKTTEEVNRLTDFLAYDLQLNTAGLEVWLQRLQRHPA
ncbi:MAG: MBL fold metallo-hydrolase [Gammaproteobacteria bacterium]|nr:MBL fold metallo-hydrolase [Gammaproteobacteria bacterium]